MVVTTLVIVNMRGERSGSVCEAGLMKEDNEAAVTWKNRCRRGVRGKHG